MRQALVNENADLVAENQPLRHAHHRRRRRRQGPARQLHRPRSRRIPCIVTTSRLLSTGVDAQTCQLIVLDRAVGSMTEFKQIVGRGTRVHEDTKKFYFTLIDFRRRDRATSPTRTSTASRCRSTSPGDDDPITPPDDAAGRRRRADPADAGRRRDHRRSRPTSRRCRPATPIAQDLRRRRRRHASSPSASSIWTRTASSSPRSCATTPRRRCKKRFASLDEFLKRWKAAERKQAIIEELASRGPAARRRSPTSVGKDLDPFDLICHVAFDQPPLTRRERAENVTKRDVFTKYGDAGPRRARSAARQVRRRGRRSISTIASVLKIDALHRDWARPSNSSSVRRHASSTSSTPSTSSQAALYRKPPRSMITSRNHRQVHPGHHAPGRRRRRRRPAHQPARAGCSSSRSSTTRIRSSS